MNLLAGRAPRKQSGLLLAAATAALLAACKLSGAEVGPEASSANEAASRSALVSPSQKTEAALPALRLLKTSPERGPIGAEFSLTGEGLPPNREIEFTWDTVEGAYHTELNNNQVEFYERLFAPKRVSLGYAATDAQGRVAASFHVPEGFGEIHDIYALADGQAVAKGGFRATRRVSISPTEGPVGTVIAIHADGLGYKDFESTLGVRYDNKYVGFISATTTHGEAEANIRAAGPPGKHVVEVGHASAATPYLNGDQSPVAHIPDFRFEFLVTADAGPPPPVVDWPDYRPAADGPTKGVAAPLPTSDDVAASTRARANVTPASGPILTKSALRVVGLAPGADVDVRWMSVNGNDLYGWDLAGQPLAKGIADANGAFSVDIGIPEDLGGWHAIRVVEGGKTAAETSFFLERSLVGIAPTRVRSGELFTVHLKGLGWTELDNSVAVTYDNAYVGYACGFASNGDVTLSLTATGGRGTHLIDLYPTIYDGGHGKYPWQYTVPQLSALQDHPGLALGYRLPVFRLAIEVIEQQRQ